MAALPSITRASDIPNTHKTEMAWKCPKVSPSEAVWLGCREREEAPIFATKTVTKSA